MFEMTARQATAMANMEGYLNIRSHRITFPDEAAFRSYWELISGRCDAMTRGRAGETPASRAERRQKRQERSVVHYRQADHLFGYGVAYAARYQPSTAKLRQHLLKKSAGGGGASGECIRLFVRNPVLGTAVEPLDDPGATREIREGSEIVNLFVEL